MDKAVTLSTTQPAARFGVIDLALVLMTGIWGSNSVLLKFTFSEIAPMAFMPLRFLLASALILIVLAARERTLGLRRGDYMKVILVGLVGTGLYQLLFINGVALTTASNSSLILSNTPAFIALTNRMLGRERLDRRGRLGIALAILGIVLIVESTSGVRLYLTRTGNLVMEPEA